MAKPPSLVPSWHQQCKPCDPSPDPVRRAGPVQLASRLQVRHQVSAVGQQLVGELDRGQGLRGCPRSGEGDQQRRHILAEIVAWVAHQVGGRTRVHAAMQRPRQARCHDLPANADVPAPVSTIRRSSRPATARGTPRPVCRRAVRRTCASSRQNFRLLGDLPRGPQVPASSGALAAHAEGFG